MRRKTNVILAAAAAIGVLGLTQPAEATILFHNGTGECLPGNEVPVNVEGCGSTNSIDTSKTFFEVVEHEMKWELISGGQGPPFIFAFNEDIANDTGIDWVDFHISFELDPDMEPVQFDVDLDVADATIQKMSGDGLIEFWIFFDEPLLDGQGFVLSGNATNFETNFLILDVRQHPSIPEPGSLALFATGLLALGLIAWRRRRLAA